jgi:hypothetical protein
MTWRCRSCLTTVTYAEPLVVARGMMKCPCCGKWMPEPEKT